MLSTSKAFRARLVGLGEHEVARLGAWVRNNCALHALFPSDCGTAVLVCLRDTRRTSASFARSLRAVLQKLAIPTSGLRGHWLHLISAEEACAICRARGTAIALGPPAHAESSGQDGEEDTRVVALR